jgi:hypothetical protein
MALARGRRSLPAIVLAASMLPGCYTVAVHLPPVPDEAEVERCGRLVPEGAGGVVLWTGTDRSEVVEIFESALLRSGRFTEVRSAWREWEAESERELHARLVGATAADEAPPPGPSLPPRNRPDWRIEDLGYHPPRGSLKLPGTAILTLGILPSIETWEGEWILRFSRTSLPAGDALYLGVPGSRRKVYALWAVLLGVFSDWESGPADESVNTRLAEGLIHEVSLALLYDRVRREGHPDPAVQDLAAVVRRRSDRRSRLVEAPLPVPEELRREDPDLEEVRRQRREFEDSRKRRGPR